VGISLPGLCRTLSSEVFLLQTDHCLVATLPGGLKAQESLCLLNTLVQDQARHLHLLDQIL
jgi:hypothetical protein